MYFFLSWRQARRYPTKEENGVSRPWRGVRMYFFLSWGQLHPSIN